MEDQDQDQDQNQDQGGEELLKLLEAEEEPGEEPASPSSLLSLTEISRLTGIMYVTLKRYAVLHDSTDLMGLWEGEGRGKKYRPEAVEVFRRLRAESKKGRPRAAQPEIAPLSPKPVPGRGGVTDPLPPSRKKGKRNVTKKGAPKRPSTPTRPESAPSTPSLSTQEADRAMAAIERVQLMARYEAVKEMVGQWGKELARLEKVLGLGPEN